MEPQHLPQPRNSHHPHLQTLVPPLSNKLPLRSSASTPMTSPGLFSPSNPRPKMNFPIQASSDSNTPNVETSSPYLHPLQKHKVRETHKALIDSDSITGRKLINQYEVIEEIGRGMHGKVKLARNLETGENVAIKIIPRYSKKRRLGKVMAMSPQEKTMREIAILKKMRHPNVVSLLEIIDDPELKKIYLILEHVELGEVVWRKKGLPHICHHERRRIEREARGEPPTPEEEQYDLIMERRLALKELKRAKMSRANMGVHDFWSMEHGASDDASYGSQSRVPSRDDLGNLDHVRGEASQPNSLQASRATSRAPSRSQSVKSVDGGFAVFDQEAIETDDMETPGPQRSNPGSATALDGTMYGAYMEDVALRGRSPSMADSIISHMSSVDWNSRMHDPFAEDFSYVPCFTIEQARTTFRDTVLGLEYLHYQGVVHRDIKPANLLWTKDHRVKISDFGVSYFGRPIRDGEPDDETVSESEAQDFDDDLELAKTVGTPAFFAPELCYTDADRMEQPKISEMIDIWSLGVTLYCLIYARIPFQAEDEWQMFRKIATEEVFIPRKRLKPVDPSTPPNSESLFKRHNVPPYRDDNELAYEDIDNLLYDLLRQMFTKNPEKRIRLRDIKRHPWIVQGIPNPITWIDDTDPARPSQGRRVQVNDKETAHAVVPIAFLERARSTVKKAVGKLMHPLGDRSDSRSRRRAASSAASSAGDSMYNVPPTPHSRDARRKSLKSEDYFSNVKDFAFNSEHPLVHSQTASPYESSYDPLATAIAQPAGAALLHALQYGSNESRTNSGTASPSDQSTIPGTGAASLYKPNQYSQSPSNGNSYLMLTANLPEVKTLPPTPFVDPTLADPLNDMRQTRGYDALTEEALRARSVERGVFREQDKRAPAQVSVTTASVPGTLHRMPSLPGRPRAMRSVDLGKAKHASNGLASPLFFSSRSVTGYQHGQPQSDSNIYENQRATTDLEERPQTAHRIENVRDVPEARTPPPRKYNNSTPESFARARDELHRKHIEEYQHQVAQQALDDVRSDIAVVDPTEYPCPVSPDDEFFGTPPPHGREYTTETRHSSRSASIGGLASPLTSPSDVNSPISSTTPPSKEEMLAFQSDPSLPALLSGSSSVSADLDAEPVEPAAVNNKQALLETTDSLTPPALVKEPMAGFPLEQYEQQERFDQQHNASFDSGSIPLRITPNTSYRSPPAIHRTPDFSPQDDDDDDSDSDEGLLMAKSKKKKSTNAHVERIPFGARRRDTNVSIASTETAKKVVIHGEDVTTYPD